jgi:hypothetical protein
MAVASLESTKGVQVTRSADMQPAIIVRHETTEEVDADVPDTYRKKDSIEG